jgi:cytidine deaminase
VAVPEEVAKEMLRREDTVRQNTYPVGGQGYVAVVLCANGEMYEGVSYNSATQTLTMHGEMTALAHAAIHGHKDVIAITGPNCHICKQLIWESALNSGDDVMIIIQEGDKIKQIPISTLMPYPWPEQGSPTNITSADKPDDF